MSRPPRDGWDLGPAARAEAGGAVTEAPAVRLLGRLLRLPPAQARLAAYLVAAAVVGIALMGLPERPSPAPSRPASGPGAGQPMAAAPAGALTPPVPAEPDEAGRDLERELETMLNLVEGVGSVRVFVTFERGSERVLAVNETREQRSTPASDAARTGQALQEQRLTRQVVVMRDSEGRREMPVVLWERHPVVRGVMVVADGARDPAVRLAIQRAVAAALDVPAHRISVQPKRR